jgi:hypothetical protein
MYGWLAYLTACVALLGSPGLTSAVASAAVLVVAVVLALYAVTGLRLSQPRAVLDAMRERARRVGVPRQRDPDAAGRARPRAPTSLLAF